MSEDGKARRAIHVLGAGVAASLLGDGTLMTVLPQAEFAAELMLNLSMVAWALSINRVVRLGFNPLAGRFLRRFPRRAILIPSMGLGALSSLLTSFGGSTAVMLGRILWGVVWAGLWVGGTTVVLDVSTEENRGRMNGLFQMWFFIGVGASSFLGGWLADRAGVRGALQISAIVAALACGLWLFFLPETRMAESRSARSRPLHWCDPDIQKPVRVAAVPMFVNRFLFAGALAVTGILWLETYLGAGVNLAGLVLPLATTAGAVSALQTIIRVVSTPITGRLSDHLRQRWTVMAGVFALGALGTALMSLPVFPAAMIGVLLSAVTSGGVQTLLGAWIGDQVPADRQEAVVGRLFSVGDAGSALGPLVALSWVQVLSIPALYQAAAVMLLLTAGYTLYQFRRACLPVGEI